ncbi:galectin-4-like [Ahaetulla prasina]|uniref:galectin-4-like n=1 Tax=Ahaetulla prasina TaxID=499056 RepID=UPI00264762E5|nr:galectin-4-like [Ahaetulla prasina]
MLRVVPDIYKETGLCCLQPRAVEMAVEFDTFRVPYNRAVPWGFDADSWMMLEGLILKQSKGFHVEFAYGQFNGANIPLKFKLRFERTPASSNSPILTVNSFVNQQWGKEIRREMATHFQQGQKFKLSFIATSKSFKIMENDILLSEFDHRLSPKAIRFLEVDGDIKLEKVVFSWERNNETSNPRFGEG